MSDLLAYLAGGALILWGLAHLAPTKAVADGFGPIGVENRRILVMEWVAEGVTHVSVGTLAVLIAVAGYASGATGDLVYRVLAGMLVALAALTALTGSRTRVLWFKACPFVLTGAATLLVLRTVV